MPDGVTIEIDRKSLSRSIETVKRLEKSVKDDNWWRRTHRRGLQPIALQMKSNSKSSRIADAIGVTTAKSKTMPKGAAVGVIRNIPSRFPDISAQGLAAIIEYGTDDRFRGGSLSLVSTGSMPADPFLRPAWIQGVARYLKHVETELTQKVEKEAGRE